MTRRIEYLCLIPAREGSKRLPGKNIKPLCGKPMIGWTIEAAREALPEAEVVVSTDGEAIMQIARDFGAQVPFSRPAQLSDSTASSIDVVLHAIEFFQSQGVQVDNLVLLQPTSPLRDSEDIRAAVQIFEQPEVRAVISVCEAEHSPLWQNTLESDDCMDNFLRPEVINKRGQDLPTYYRLNGAIYVASVEDLKTHKSFFLEKGTKAYKMATQSSVDIDHALDFQLAEILKTEQLKT